MGRGTGLGVEDGSQSLPEKPRLASQAAVGSAPSPAGPGQVEAARNEADLKSRGELLHASGKPRGWPLPYLTPGAPPVSARQQEPSLSGV